jgi:prevent-host-death family protein
VAPAENAKRKPVAAVRRRTAGPGDSISSREFNQDVGRAKRAAEKGPVTITDRGRPAFVLMKHEDYLRLSGRPKTLLDMLADDRPEADFDFEFPRLSDDMGLRIPDFSED